ncbi:MAG: phosphatidylglycerol lysyltransferase domain-containing protein [Tannerella sp.]|jgi:hypothetical protein|nr:phosphatidylglycerol lysyltransferase domain-containing protein [Tannerella sp.]
MLSFKPITIEDKGIITACTYPNNLLNCDYAFANMCSWSFLYNSEYAIADNYLFIRFDVEEKGHSRHNAYMFPVGNGDLKHAIDIIEQDAEALGRPLLILGVTPEAKKKLDALFPNSFTYIKERDFYDYIYLREDLSTLKGKKFQPKRNHINKFKKQYNYAYLPITPEIIPECMKLEQVWYQANKVEGNSEDLFHERHSMIFAMEHFNELGLTGGAIVTNNKIVAFTYGSPINCKTFGIHVEKADISYEGIFSVINQEFAAHIPQEYIYLNREEDLGIPGLRKSKLSYQPVLLLEKNATVKRR